MGAGWWSSRSSRPRIARKYSRLSWSTTLKQCWPVIDLLWRTASRYKIPMAPGLDVFLRERLMVHMA
jgi:hypothetical protein